MQWLRRLNEGDVELDFGLQWHERSVLMANRKTTA